VESRADFLGILRALHAHEVEYLVVGGVCALLHGAPVTTFDLDLVHSRDERNVDRLLAALTDIEARYRPDRDPPIAPAAEPLAGAGHHLLMTRFGPLDLLGEVGVGLRYEDLVDDAVISTLPDMEVQIMSLRRLIEVKQQVGRTKDKLMLPILLRTLRDQEDS